MRPAASSFDTACCARYRCLPAAAPCRRDHQEPGACDRPAGDRRPVQQRRVFRQLLQAAGDRRHPRKGRQRQRGEHQPVTLPSAPVSPIASAAEIALISMQPQAAPAMNCATISMLSPPANSATRIATAPNRPAAPITINPPRCLTTRLAGNIAMIEADPEHRHQPLQIGRLGKAQIERPAVDGEMQLIAEREDHHRRDEDHRARCRTALPARPASPAPRRSATVALDPRQRERR